jgi:hypothetical protein
MHDGQPFNVSIWNRPTDGLEDTINRQLRHERSLAA